MLAARFAPSVGFSARSFSTSAPRASFAKLTLAGNLVESPRKGQTQSGRDYYLFRLATSDPVGPPGPDGQPTRSSTFHNVLSYKYTDKDWVAQIPKGSLLHVEAAYSKKSTKMDDGTYKEDTFLKLDNMHILKRGENASEESA